MTKCTIIKRKKCRDCIHMFRHEFNRSMCYCNAQLSDTSYKRKRVSPISDVCHYFHLKDK